MRNATRLARTAAGAAIGAAALVIGSSTQITHAEQPAEGDASELSQEESELLESGAPAHVIYNADTGEILSITPADI